MYPNLTVNSRARRCLMCQDIIPTGEMVTLVMCGDYTRAIHQNCITKYEANKAKKEAKNSGGKAGTYSRTGGRVIRKTNPFS